MESRPMINNVELKSPKDDLWNYQIKFRNGITKVWNSFFLMVHEL